MSKRRKPGEWVRLLPNSGFVGESNRLLAQIQPEDDPIPCFLCEDKECTEWATLRTEPDPQDNNKRHVLCHISECQMLDANAPEKSTTDSLIVLDIIQRALSFARDKRINDVSYDNDNDSGEIILSVDDGKEITDWIIRSKQIEQVDRETDVIGE